MASSLGRSLTFCPYVFHRWLTLAAEPRMVLPAVSSTRRGKARRDVTEPAPTAGEAASRSAASTRKREDELNAPSRRRVSRGQGSTRTSSPSTHNVSRTRRHQGLASYSYKRSCGVGGGPRRGAGVRPNNPRAAEAADEVSQSARETGIALLKLLSRV
eukprot:scaffold5650_cov129-Isochrysis_galbana.AAC.2